MSDTFSPPESTKSPRDWLRHVETWTTKLIGGHRGRSLKQVLLTTGVGHRLLDLGRWRTLRGVPFNNPENAGCVGNDILADKLLAGICRPGGTFLDIGSHIGSVVSAVHHCDPSVEIIAFEAEPDKAEALQRRFGFCTVHALAVGEAEGEAEFFINTQASGYNSLVGSEDGTQRKIRVRIATLDGLLPDASVDVIKIDIEGAELGALRGGQQLVARGKPTIMFESVGTAVNALGYSAEQLWQWLDAQGYDVLTPDRVAHETAGMSLDAFIDAHQYPFRTHNYFAVHAQRRAEVRERARRILSLSV